jgi:hypothetical protein
MAPTPTPFTPDEQYAALCVLEFVSDLFTMAGKESFTKVEVLSVLANIRDDVDFFDPAVVIAQQQATEDI